MTGSKSYLQLGYILPFEWANRRCEKTRDVMVRRRCLISLVLLLPIVIEGCSGLVSGAQNPAPLAHSVTLSWTNEIRQRRRTITDRKSTRLNSSHVKIS